MSSTKVNSLIVLGVVDLVLSVVLLGCFVGGVCGTKAPKLDGSACCCAPGSECDGDCQDCVCPKREAYVPSKAAELDHPVNKAAQAEKKQGVLFVEARDAKGQCLDGSCSVQSVAAQYGAQIMTTANGIFAALPEGYVWNATNQRGTQAFSNQAALIAQMQLGVRRPQPQPQPVVRPNTGPLRINIGDRPANRQSRSHIMLFVLPGDEKSNQLKAWFDSSPELAAWRQGCTYQEYTPSSLLYRAVKTRDGRALRDVVPVADFPAVIWAAPDGGHIHAASQDAIPDSAAELAADFTKGLDYYKQVVNQDQVLSTSDCGPDGCYPPQPPNPDANDTSWENNNRDRDGSWLNGFKNRKPVEKEGIVKDAMWGWLDIAAKVVLGLVIVLAILAICGGLLVYGIARLFAKD